MELKARTFKEFFEEEDYHQKRYYFFRAGEFEYSVDEDNPEKAISVYLNDSNTSKQFDFLIEYDKKFGGYTTFRNDFFKKYLVKKSRISRRKK